MYRLLPYRVENTVIFGGNRYLVPWGRGIATPVCELARNDREFDKFRFVAPQNDTERVVLHAVNLNLNDCRGQSYLN